MKQLNDPRWQPCITRLEVCCMLSRHWSEQVQRYIKLHGDVIGCHTSGCYNPDWPETVKNRLRDLAFGVGLMEDEAYRFRPRKTHRSTVTSIARFIARRDGSGYYGPQG